MSKIQIQFVGGRVKVMRVTPQWKIDHAVQVIDDAYSGKLKFHINEFLPPPKQYKSEKRTHKWLCEHAHDPTHDHHTCKLWRKNLNMIRDACKLLYSEGIIDGYHVDGSGTLHVKWFTKYVPVVRQVRTAMRTGEELQRADVFAQVRYPEVDQYLDITPTKDPYHHPMWRVYEEMEEDYEDSIHTRMMMRQGQADVLKIISRAYAEYDLDTLHNYNAPLSCDITDKQQLWEVVDYD